MTAHTVSKTAYVAAASYQYACASGRVSESVFLTVAGPCAQAFLVHTTTAE